MTTTSPHESPASHSQGSVSKMKRLHEDGKHSIAELREFVAQMRGRSPQEVLGIVSTSGLVRATLQATVGIAVFIAIFTIGPYFLAKVKPVAAKPATPANTQSAQPEVSVAQGDAPSAPDASTPTTTLPEPDAAKAAKALDIGETKTADPNVNPLDKDLDKLLDGK